jgi:hypothetical protein
MHRDLKAWRDSNFCSGGDDHYATPPGLGVWTFLMSSSMSDFTNKLFYWPRRHKSPAGFFSYSSRRCRQLIGNKKSFCFVLLKTPIKNMFPIVLRQFSGKFFEVKVLIPCRRLPFQFETNDLFFLGGGGDPE